MREIVDSNKGMLQLAKAKNTIKVVFQANTYSCEFSLFPSVVVCQFASSIAPSSRMSVAVASVPDLVSDPSGPITKTSPLGGRLRPRSSPGIAGWIS